MTTNPTPPAPSPDFSAGFDAGLASARSLYHDLETLSLARALATLGQHAAVMDNRDEDTHDGCVECNAMILLTRVVRFGDQLRKAERRS